MAIFSRKALEKYESKHPKPRKEHTILIVDDEEHNLITLSDLLSEEYEILSAASGKDALEVINSCEDPERIHLIISDQRMPEMQGVDFLAKTIPILPKTIRMILTGFTDVEAMISSINEANIYRFVLKPFNQEDMLLTVRRALETYQLEMDNLNLMEELKQTNLNLEKTVEERTYKLKHALEDLKETNKMKDKFFSIIAHDTSNMFTSLIAASQILEYQIEAHDKETIMQIGKTISQSAQRLFRLMENLLEWAKIQKGRLECSPQPLKMNELIRECMDIVAANATEKEIRITNKIPESTKVFADMNMVKTILRNLMNNAVKFTYPKGEVVISSQELDEDTLEISITDTGIGISEKDVKTIFRIDHGHTAGTRGEHGNGLGLILCKELVEKNGGTIRAESSAGEGATFTISLPIRPREDLLPSTPPENHYVS